MTQQSQAVPTLADEGVPASPLLPQLVVNIATQSWLASMALHMTLLIVLALVLGTIHVAATIGAAPAFEVPEEPKSLEPEIEHFVVGEAPLEPTILNAQTLTSEPPAGLEDALAESFLFEPAGGTVNPGQLQSTGMSFASDLGLGPALREGAGSGGLGLGMEAGQGGAQAGYSVRTGDARSKLRGLGATIPSERAVAAALNWLARHQSPDGRWSLDHTPRCKSGSCSGPGQQRADAAATALGLLPFLAAGQTHESVGPYRKNIAAGIDWLIKNQQRTGDLSSGGSQMYSHGLATIALCEAYGMTHDSRVGYAAQAALDFIISGQNKEGAWRYTHGTESSDTSVFGWQVMALKSGQMAGLKVQPAALDGCRQYLRKVAQGQYQSEFSYAPGGGPTFTMTSVGLLTSQYLGARRDDPVIVGGLDYLSRRKPSAQQRNSYYWYYATQVMHNVPGPQWDDWNRAMRRLLIETQEQSGCQSGSWDPSRPEPDPWGNQGGRLMVTSLSCLTLEVYYRYLPLYKIDGDGAELKGLP